MGLKMKVKVVVVMAVALLLLPGVSHALTLQQKALVGLKGVGVDVAKISPEAERLGLTAAQVKTDVELRLRKARVRVLTEKERLETPGNPFFHLVVTAGVSQDSASIAFSIGVELVEWVTLARGFETWGAIWRKGAAGRGGINNIGDIRGAVGDKVDEFINDYLAANPQ
jgi:hypothetical protein